MYLPRMGEIRRFAEQYFVDDYCRIGAQHQDFIMAQFALHRTGFFQRHTPDVVLGRLKLERCLVDFDRLLAKLQTDLVEQFTAPR